VDTHVHASQYANAGTGLDLPLLEWLPRYTFPLEATFSDVTFATAAYRKAVVSRWRALKSSWLVN